MVETVFLAVHDHVDWPLSLAPPFLAIFNHQEGGPFSWICGGQMGSSGSVLTLGGTRWGH